MNAPFSRSHGHHDHHDHHDHHHHAHASENRLLLAFALTTLMMLAEAVGGWLSGSLALLADAGHMAVDALALLLAWGGARLAQRPADGRRSFGYGRLEVLAGYTNALGQVALTVWITAEAVGRFMTPTEILSGLMFWVALAGLLVNLVVLRVIGGHDHGDEDNLNVAGARLHVLGDLLGSVGAVSAALLIGWQDWRWADPAVSVLLALLILNSAWRLLRRSAHILLEGAPEDIDAALVSETLGREAGVENVHHLHVWQLAQGQRLATLHARLAVDTDAQTALLGVRRVLRERFRIGHATVQIELGDCEDRACAPQNVHS
jgi:cobalt-zinc-cadmium efflux system protein